MKPAAVANPDAARSDAELVHRCAAGDPEALRALMKRHNQLLYRTARSILRNDAEAEDAVQEAWLRAWRAMDTFRSESKLSTWLVRIAANEALARLRASSRRAEVIRLDVTAEDEAVATEVSMQQPEPDRPDRAAERGELRRLLEARIDELPETFRAVFVLRAVQDMSVEEVAACLELPEATVRTRHFRARAMLRELLEKEIDLAVADAFAFAGARCDRIIARVLERIERERPRRA